MDNTYQVKIEICNKELTPQQRIAIKDISDSTPIGELSEGETLTINPDIYAVLDIHNEKSENKDYKVYVIVDKNGVKYSTSSDSFWNSFKNIVDEMAEYPNEDYAIKVFTKPSKNYKGKFFITCAIA